MFLDNNQYAFDIPSFECLLAVGQKNSITLNYPTDFNQLKSYSEKNKDWLFGHISYPSHKKDEIDFPNLFFFHTSHCNSNSKQSCKDWRGYH